jgi:hypothetical protein
VNPNLSPHCFQRILFVSELGVCAFMRQLATPRLAALQSGDRFPPAVYLAPFDPQDSGECDCISTYNSYRLHQLFHRYDSAEPCGHIRCSSLDQYTDSSLANAPGHATTCPFFSVSRFSPASLPSIQTWDLPTTSRSTSRPPDFARLRAA